VHAVITGSASLIHAAHQSILIGHHSSFDGMNTLSLVAWIYVRKASFYPVVMGKGNVGDYKAREKHSVNQLVF